MAMFGTAARALTVAIVFVALTAYGVTTKPQSAHCVAQTTAVADATLPLAQTAYAVAAGDFNGDGTYDLVAGTNDGVSLFNNVGNATWSAEGFITTACSAVRLVVVDFDRDNLPDLLVGCEQEAILLGNNGAGSFTSLWNPLFHYSQVGHVGAADANGDGWPDVFIANGAESASVEVGSDAPSVSVRLNSGTGTLGGTIPIVASSPENPIALATLDADGDGLADVAVAYYSSGIKFYRSTGTSFAAPVAIDPYTRTIDLFVLDSNGDGNVDLAATAEWGGHVNVWFGAGDATFASPGLEASTTLRGRIAAFAADINGDGLDDIVGMDTDFTVDVIESIGDTFGPQQTLSNPSNNPYSGTYFPGAASGGLSIAIGTQNTGGILVFRGDALPAYSLPAASVELTGATGVPSLGDWNSDGRPDIMLTTSTTAALYLNLGGLFGVPRTVVVPATGSSLATVCGLDVDSDGALDVVSAYVFGSLVVPDQLFWMKNAGDATFGAPVVFATSPRTVNNLHAIDIDGDDSPDLVYTADNLALFVVINSFSSLTAAAPLQVAPSTTASIVDVFDVDGDSWSDLVVFGYFTEKVAVLFNNGGGFDAPLTVAASVNTLATVSALDIDADGDLEVVYASSTSGVFWVENTGGQTFGGTSTHVAGTGGSLRSVHPLNANGDEFTDIIVVAAGTPSGTALFLNTGASDFDAAVILTSTQGYNSVVADFTGDGVLDIAITISSAAVYWFEGLARTALTLYPPRVRSLDDIDCHPPTSSLCLAAAVHATSRCARDTLLLAPGTYSCFSTEHLTVSHRLAIAPAVPGTVAFNCTAAAATPYGGVLFRVAPDADSPLIGDLELTDILVEGMGVATGSLEGSPGLRVTGSGARLALANCTIASSRAAPLASAASFVSDAGRGGGLGAVNGGALEVVDSRVVGGSATEAGAGAFARGAGSSLTLVRSVVNSCVSDNVGGGVAVLDGATVAVTDASLTSNTAATAGGGLWVEHSATVSVAGSTIARNSAGVGGGAAVSPSMAAAAATTTSVAVAPAPPSLMIASSTLASNTAASYGGGVAVCNAWLGVDTTVTWTSNSVGQSAAGSSGDVFVCASTAPLPVGVNATRSTVPWVDGDLPAAAAVHGPVTALVWASTPAGSLQAGESLVGRVSARGWLGQPVVYSNVLMQLVFDAPAGVVAVQGPLTPLHASEVALPSIAIGVDANTFAARAAVATVPYTVGVVGSAAALTGSVGVEPCRVGFGGSRDDADVLTCVECVEGAFSETVSFDPCVALGDCPPNSGRNAVGNATCFCEPTFWAPNTALPSTCVACPPGGACAGGLSRPVAAPGFYPRGGPGATGEAVFVACVRSGCMGGADAACAPGYTGYMCGVCADGWYSSEEHVCSACPSAAVAALVAAAIALALVCAGAAAFVGWSALHSAQKDDDADGLGTSPQAVVDAFRRRKLPVTMSMVLITLQVVGVVAQADLKWSPRVGSLFRAFAVVNIDSSTVAADCSVGSWHSAYVASVLVFPGMLCLSVAMLGLGRILVASLRTVPFRSLTDGVLFTLGPLLYLPLSKATLVVFDCSTLPNGQAVLDADNGVACFDAAWWRVAWIGFISTAVLMVGMPGYFAVSLWRRRDRLFDRHVSARFGSLYRNWRATAWWGELAGLAKRVVIVSLALFLSKHQLVQIVALLAVFVGWMVWLRGSAPYFVPLYNGVSLRLSACVVGVLLIGMASYADRVSDASEDAIFVAAVLVVVVLAGTAIHGLVCDIRSIRADRTGNETTAVMRFDALAAHLTRELQDMGRNPDLADATDEYLAALRHAATLRDASWSGDSGSATWLTADSAGSSGSSQGAPVASAFDTASSSLSNATDDTGTTDTTSYAV